MRNNESSSIIMRMQNLFPYQIYSPEMYIWFSISYIQQGRKYYGLTNIDIILNLSRLSRKFIALSFPQCPQYSRSYEWARVLRALWTIGHWTIYYATSTIYYAIEFYYATYQLRWMCVPGLSCGCFICQKYQRVVTIF